MNPIYRVTAWQDGMLSNAVTCEFIWLIETEKKRDLFVALLVCKASELLNLLPVSSPPANLKLKTCSRSPAE